MRTSTRIPTCEASGLGVGFAYLLFQLAHSIYPNGAGSDIKVLVQFPRTGGGLTGIDICCLLFLFELSADGAMSWMWWLNDVLCISGVGSKAESSFCLRAISLSCKSNVLKIFTQPHRGGQTIFQCINQRIRITKSLVSRSRMLGCEWWSREQEPKGLITPVTFWVVIVFICMGSLCVIRVSIISLSFSRCLFPSPCRVPFLRSSPLLHLSSGYGPKIVGLQRTDKNAWQTMVDLDVQWDRQPTSPRWQTCHPKKVERRSKPTHTSLARSRG
jgi:hypothetical protein